MSLNLLDLQPHQVSRNLRGYSVLFYGEPKSGKTTTATKFPKHLIIGFEKGWNAIPGAMAMPVNSWTDFLKVLRQLKDPSVKERFETIIIDTADIAYDYCEKYICNQNDVETIGKIPYGQGYTLVKKEFDEKLRQIVQLDFGVVLISHAVDKQFTDEAGIEYNQIVPTLPNGARTICARMCDIIGYSRSVETEDGNKTKLFMRGTPRYVAGSRFAYTPDHIDFSYDNLVNAIADAIDKQVAVDGGDYVTDDRVNLNTTNNLELSYDDVRAEFDKVAAQLMTQDPDKNGPRIVQVVERHLGKGKKVAETTLDQAELIDIINYELKDLLA